MPTYEYVCEKCGDEFEQLQSITAGALRKCRQCGKNSLKRLIGAGSAIIFKGSGFYETDYRSESYKKGKKSEQSKSESSKTDSSKADSSKTEKKKDTKVKKSKDTKKASA